jgi:hypothetical protein
MRVHVDVPHAARRVTHQDPRAHHRLAAQRSREGHLLGRQRPALDVGDAQRAGAVGRRQRLQRGIAHVLAPQRVGEEQAAVAADDVDRLVHEVDQRLQPRRVLGALALEPPRLGDVVEDGHGAARVAERDGVHEIGHRPVRELVRVLGPDDRLAVRERPRDRMERRRLLGAVGRARGKAREQRTDRAAEERAGAEGAEGGGVGEGEPAAGVRHEHGLDERVEDGTGNGSRIDGHEESRPTAGG